MRIGCCGAGAAYTLPIVRSLANYTLISLTHERAAQAAAEFAAIGGPRLALRRVEATRGRAEDLTLPPPEGEMGNVKIEALATHPQGLLSTLSPRHATRRNSCGGLWLSKSCRASRSGFLTFLHQYRRRPGTTNDSTGRCYGPRTELLVRKFVLGVTVTWGTGRLVEFRSSTARTPRSLPPTASPTRRHEKLSRKFSLSHRN